MLRRSILLAIAIVFISSPAHAQYVPGISQSGPAVPGQPIVLTACCFDPGSLVTFFIGGAQVGTARAFDPGGRGPRVPGALTPATGEFVVPADVTAGATISASGMADGEAATFAAELELETPVPAVPGAEPVTAVAAAVAEEAGLPPTGTSTSAHATALALALVAGGLVVLGARRRSLSRHERP